MAMRKLTIIAYITLNDVIQAPDSPSEDKEFEFEYGGWAS